MKATKNKMYAILYTSLKEILFTKLPPPEKENIKCEIITLE